MKIRTTKKRVLAVLAILVLSASTAGYAFYASGSTTAQFQVAGAPPATAVLLRNASVGGGGAMAPGDVRQVTFNVWNVDPGTQAPTGTTVSIPGVTGTVSGLPAGCDPAWFTFSGATFSPPVLVPSGISQDLNAGTLTFANLASVDQSACSNASPTLNLAIASS